MCVGLFLFPFGFTKILMISSSDPAAYVFANRSVEVRKSVQSFNDDETCYSHYLQRRNNGDIKRNFYNMIVCQMSDFQVEF